MIDSNLFKGFTNDEYEAFMTQTVTKVYEKGAPIFERNSPSHAIFILLEGKVSLEKIDINGKRFILNFFNHSGTMMGEVYTFLGLDYDYDLIAVKKSKVLIIERDLVMNYPDISLNRKIMNNLITILAQKALVLNKKNQIISSYSLRQKIANYLNQFKEKDIVKIDMTRQEWADYLGTTRPSLSRELSNMEQENLIRLEDAGIRILNENSLNELL